MDFNCCYLLLIFTFSDPTLLLWQMVSISNLLIVFIIFVTQKLPSQKARIAGDLRPMIIA